MKTPEKIYYNTSFHDYWKEDRESVKDIEYIRKDIVDDMLKTAEDHAYFAGSEAMMEKLVNKACEWLDSITLEYYAERVDEFIADFRKAMN